jgi:hypothetical protein
MGYAFLNFTSPMTLIPFYSMWNGKRWPLLSSRKHCELAYGRIQGKRALVEHFMTSRILLSAPAHCRPLLFVSHGPRKGEQEVFPSR